MSMTTKRKVAAVLLLLFLDRSWTWTTITTTTPVPLSLWGNRQTPRPDKRIGRRSSSSHCRPPFTPVCTIAAAAVMSFHYDPFFDDENDDTDRKVPYASIASFEERNRTTKDESLPLPNNRSSRIDPMATTPGLQHLQSVVASFATNTTAGDNNTATDTPSYPPLVQLQYDEDRILEHEEEEDDTMLSVHSLVFAVTNSTTGAYVLAITPSHGRRVNVTRLEQAVPPHSLTLAPAALLPTLCGHAAGCIPPLLGLCPAPLWTVVDAAAAACSSSSTTTFVGGGGLPDQSLLVHGGVDTLLLLQPDTVRVAYIMDDAAAAPDRWVPPVVVAPTYFAVDPSTHTTGVVFSFVGRVQQVRRMAKELVFCDIVAPDGGSWRNPANDQPLPVQLIAGATVCATSGSSSCLRSLQPDRLVLVQGTIGTSSTSVANWENSERGLLDVVVHSFTVLEAVVVGTDNSNNSKSSSSKKGRRAWKAQQQDRHQRASLTAVTPVDPTKCLRLDTVCAVGGAPSTTETTDYNNYTTAPILVDDMASAQQFSHDVGVLLRTTTATTTPLLVGLDAEWIPSLLAPGGEPRPVLLLQIALHDLRKVYLLDVQTLLRPLLPRTHKMDKLEKEVAFALGAMLESKKLVKVGFQVVDDLRHVAASFPHMEALHFCNAVLEVSLLGKKVIRRTHSGNSRAATASLAKTVQHFFDDDRAEMDKTQQCSDWSQRPLTAAQHEYAALDAAVTPVLVERMLANMTAAMPVASFTAESTTDFFEREKLLTSYRFVFVDDANPTVLKRLKAKRVVGSMLVVSQYWTTGDVPPGLPDAGDADSGGAFRDTYGVLQIPSHSVSIHEKRNYEKLLGTCVGKSKTQCVTPLLATSLPTGARLDFFQRSGFIEFQNGVALFVSLPVAEGGRLQTYPNEWLDTGKSMSWFIRASEWKQGHSNLAQKMMCINSSVLLFVKLTDGPFCLCGQCSVHTSNDDDYKNDTVADWELLEFRLDLIDWEVVKNKFEFQNLVQCSMR